MRVSSPNAVGIFVDGSFWRDARVRRGTVKLGDAVDLVVAVAQLKMASNSNGRRIIVGR